jgi:photosystem II stability/assembly factor-like uncharacterized protein
MKKTNIFALTGIVVVAAVSVYSLGLISKPSYQPRETIYYPSAYIKKSALGAAEYHKMLKANPLTGEIDLDEVLRVREQVEAASANRAAGLDLVWHEMGPDNVGGRTRAFLIHPLAPSIMFAGGVSGGLFKSTDGGANWRPVDDQMSNLIVSWIAIGPDGAIYVATGEGLAQPSGINYNTGSIGGGIFKSTDNGNTFTLLPSTKPTPNNPSAEFAIVNSIAVDPNNPNRIYAGTSRGLRVSEDGGQTWRNDYILSATNVPIIGVVRDIAVSRDGTVAISLNNRCYVSPTGDAGTFTATSLNVNGFNARLELGISPTNSNIIYAALANGSGQLASVQYSSDKGQTWTSIGQGVPGVFDPFGSNGQGWYDNIIEVNPYDDGEVFFGGVELWKWKRVTTNPVSGQWTRIAFEFPASPQNPFYVHSDKHNVQWHPTNPNAVYVTTDGGIAFSPNGGQTWTTLNKGYNTLQLYGFDFSGIGEVLGGTQDNGTQYIDFSMPNSYMSSRQMTGGDGGHCAISKLDNRILFSTIYYGSVYRSNDKANSIISEFSPRNTVSGTFNASFVTPIRLWESKNDPLSTDSIWFKNTTNASIPAGTTITLLSNTASYPFQYTLNTTLAPGDSVRVKDPVQARFAMGASGHVWLSRRALDFGANPSWIKIANINGTAQHLAFSKDGNTLWVGTQGGLLYRITGLANLKDTMATPSVTSPPASVVTTQQITISTGGRPITDIAVDPNNPDHVIVTLGSYGSSSPYLLRSTNATSPNPTFSGTGLHGTGPNALPQMPIYSCVIDQTDGRRIILGTEYGIWTCNDVTAANKVWTRNTNGIPNVPVHMVRQQDWANNWPEITNQGVIYAATHGRGFFKSYSLAAPTTGVKENRKTELVNGFTVYPNPVNAMGKINIELANTIEKAEVKFYSIDGKQVKNIPLSNLRVGNNTVDYTVNELPMGTYFVRFEGANVVKTTKLVVVK